MLLLPYLLISITLYVYGQFSKIFQPVLDTAYNLQLPCILINFSEIFHETLKIRPNDEAVC